MRRTSRIQPLARAFGLLLLLAAISGCEDNAPKFQSAGNSVGIIDCQFPPAMAAMRSHPSQTSLVSASTVPLPKAIESQLKLNPSPPGRHYNYSLQVRPSNPYYVDDLHQKIIETYNLAQPVLVSMGDGLFWVPEDKHDYIMDLMKAKGYLDNFVPPNSDRRMLLPPVSKGGLYTIFGVDSDRHIQLTCSAAVGKMPHVTQWSWCMSVGRGSGEAYTYSVWFNGAMMRAWREIEDDAAVNINKYCTKRQ